MYAQRSRLILAALALLYFAGCYQVPVTGRSAMNLVDDKEVTKMSISMFDDMKRHYRVSRDPALNAQLQRVGARISKAVFWDMPDADWEFVVFDSKELNAFALPGGKVGVYTGLLRLAENDSELAIVMGHEIGHVIARHGAERMSEGMVIAGIGAITWLSMR